TLFGRIELGNAVLSKAVEELRNLAPGSDDLALALDLQAYALMELGNYAEAGRLLEEAAGIHARVHDPPQVVNENRMARAHLLVDEGRAAEAATALEGYVAEVAPRGTLSLSEAQGLIERAVVHLARGETDRALELSERVRAAVERDAGRSFMKIYEAQAALL